MGAAVGEQSAGTASPRQAGDPAPSRPRIERPGSAVRPVGWPERCGACGAPWAEIGFDFGLGFNCRACGGADADE